MSAGFPPVVSGSAHMDVSDQSMEPLLPQPTTTGDRPFGRSGKASRAPLTGVAGRRCHSTVVLHGGLLTADCSRRIAHVAGQFRDSGLVSWMRAAGHGVTTLGLASGSARASERSTGRGSRGEEASVLAGPRPDCHSTVALQCQRDFRLMSVDRPTHLSAAQPLRSAAVGRCRAAKANARSLAALHCHLTDDLHRGVDSCGRSPS
jgi:hypothetical protein